MQHEIMGIAQYRGKMPKPSIRSVRAGRAQRVGGWNTYRPSKVGPSATPSALLVIANMWRASNSYARKGEGSCERRARTSRVRDRQGLRRREASVHELFGGRKYVHGQFTMCGCREYRLTCASCRACPSGRPPLSGGKDDGRNGGERTVKKKVRISTNVPREGMYALLPPPPFFFAAILPLMPPPPPFLPKPPPFFLRIGLLEPRRASRAFSRPSCRASRASSRPSLRSSLFTKESVRTISPGKSVVNSGPNPQLSKSRAH